LPKDSFQDRTEKATPKRRLEARQEGNVARSIEINSALILLVCTLTLYFFANWMISRIKMGMAASIKHATQINLTADNLNDYALIAIQFIAENVAPLALLIILFGIAANILQVGFLVSFKSMQPKLSKINPVEGFRRLFSLRSLTELIKGILKIVIVGYVAYLTIKGEFDQYNLLMDSDIYTIVSVIGKLAFKLALKITLILAVLGVLDFLYQKWEHERNLRMTKQEVSDEHKQAEGDPLIKGKIRTMQRQFMINAMIKELPSADVVITNPVHVAVALKYESSAMAAPKVVAKGARKMAERIKSIAMEHDIPIMENPELARALYKSVDVGVEIPPKFYQAVAEVLSYIYQLKNKKFV